MLIIPVPSTCVTPTFGAPPAIFADNRPYIGHLKESGSQRLARVRELPFQNQRRSVSYQLTVHDCARE
ncbi:hypothetical protein [Bradyrhizobium sp.]|uniref:hypothetical protein n=1 Tax=Bradyrhizobium sp. TaxID=376 RepID=UPI002D416FFD|nr:hypothetical protein [Bradyrhizobium sp.]HZR77111.1 hypothetical protein [Bradyrhizobium sp.]